MSIEPGGRLDINSAANLSPNASVYVGSFGGAGSNAFGSVSCALLGILSLDGNVFPTLNPNSSGILSLQGGQSAYGNPPQSTGSTSTAINAALAIGAPQVGDGYMYIGVIQVPGMGSTTTFNGSPCSRT